MTLNNRGGKIAKTICEKYFPLCLLEEYVLVKRNNNNNNNKKVK